jgi:hypothetical protein
MAYRGESHSSFLNRLLNFTALAEKVREKGRFEFADA